MSRVLSVLVCLAALAGCTNYQAQYRQQELVAAQSGCKDRGLVEGTEAYAECFNSTLLGLLELDQAPSSGGQTPLNGGQGGSVYSEGQPVYKPNECIGSIVMGVCQGQVLPDATYHPRCYGQIPNGVCTGPMF
jgi:hypothetical protein